MERFPPSSPEQASERQEHRFEQRDAKGELMYRTVMVTEDIYDHGVEPTKRVFSLKMISPEDVEVDVAERLGIAFDGPEAVKVVFREKGVMNGVSRWKSKKIIMETSPESVIGLGLLAHEVGHAKQHQDPEWKEAVDLYDTLFHDPFFNRDAPTKNTIKRIFEAVPEPERIQQDADVQAYLKKLDELDEKDESVEALNRKARAIDKEIKILQKGWWESLKTILDVLELKKKKKVIKEEEKNQAKEWVDAIAKLPETGEQTNIQKLSLLPVRLLERDANVKALLFLRSLEKDGFRVFADIKWKKRGEEVVTTIRDELREGVEEIHGATLKNMRFATHDGPEKSSAEE